MLNFEQKQISGQKNSWYGGVTMIWQKQWSKVYKLIFH